MILFMMHCLTAYQVLYSCYKMTYGSKMSMIRSDIVSGITRQHIDILLTAKLMSLILTWWTSDDTLHTPPEQLFASTVQSWHCNWVYISLAHWRQRLTYLIWSFTDPWPGQIRRTMNLKTPHIPLPHKIWSSYQTELSITRDNRGANSEMHKGFSVHEIQQKRCL